MFLAEDNLPVGVQDRGQIYWQPCAAKDFRRIVGEFTEKPAWIVDGNYGKVRDLVWSRANTVVFLDLPRWQVIAQLLRRTLGRMVTRRQLWNGNREEWRNFVSMDPEKNLILWSWANHERRRKQFDAGKKNPAYLRTRFVRLENRREQRLFIDGCVDLA